jgi:hypothetical protein
MSHNNERINSRGRHNKIHLKQIKMHYAKLTELQREILTP